VVAALGVAGISWLDRALESRSASQPQATLTRARSETMERKCFWLSA
jgi:hypothetical protein